MTTKVLSGTYSAGYTIHAPVTVVSITSSGYVRGTGVQSPTIASTGYTVINQGRIRSTQAGIYLRHGGAVTNGAPTNFGASIIGTYAGVGILGGIGTVTNYGSITSPSGASYKFADVTLAEGGVAINGSAADTHALMSGYDGVAVFAAAGTVTNFGSIIGTATQNPSGTYKIAGVYLALGGAVTNGSAGVIKGAVGISAERTATVVNYGAVADLNHGSGVRLGEGGSVTNGGASATAATINGYDYGVQFVFGGRVAGTLTNFGSIQGGIGVGFQAGGRAVNGSALDKTATISGERSGVYAQGPGSFTLVNYGNISGQTQWGVRLVSGGGVTNGSLADTSALITGKIGLSGGGYNNAEGTFANFGTIIGTNGAGDMLYPHALLINGAVGDTKALIEGLQGVYIKFSGTVTNFGSIVGTGGGTAIVLNSHGYLQDSGVFTNGAANDTAALISGFYGIDGQAQDARYRSSGTVTNFGTILGSSATGIVLGYSSRVVNGSKSDTAALIISTADFNSRGNGISAYSGTVLNYGSILSTGGGYGVKLTQGSLTNGSAADSKALIQGYGGFYGGSHGTLINFGTITASLGFAVRLSYGMLAVEAGSSINGKINGGGGTLDLAGGTGTISSIADAVITTSAASGSTVYTRFYTLQIGSAATFTLSGSGTISTMPAGQQVSQLQLDGHLAVNGGLIVTAATVSGDGLLSFASGSSVFDFGSVIAVAHVAMFATSQLTLKTSFVYQGAWDQAGGTLSLNSGVTFGLSGEGGTLAGILTGGGILQIVAGAKALVKTLALAAGDTLDNQGDVDQLGVVTLKSGVIVNERGAGWLLSGASGIALAAAGNGSFVNAGVLTVSGGTTPIAIRVAAVANSGDINITGGTLALSAGLQMSNSMIEGAGALSLTNGSAVFQAGSTLNMAEMEVSGAATKVEVAEDITFAGVWKETGGALTIDAGDTLALNGAANTLSGSIAGPGTLTLEGSTTLSSVTLSVAQVQFDGAPVTLAGIIKVSGIVTADTPTITISQAGATLEGGGSIALSSGAFTWIKGAASATRLVNISDTISGSGDLGGGQLFLNNQKAGTIEATFGAQLMIDTGKNTIANTGLIEASHNGVVTIQSAIANDGVLMAVGGTLAVSGAVSSFGSVSIDGGVAEFTSAFTQRVTFTSNGGELMLSHSLTYLGTITGFSTTGASSLDLGDINFVSGTTSATFHGTTTAGVLTVTDGSHTAKIKLAGQFIGSTFTVSSDGHGGTQITNSSAPSVNAFATAMAGVGATPCAGGVGASSIVMQGQTAILATPISRLGD